METARRAAGDISRIFRYAINTNRASSDPSQYVRETLPSPKEQHFAAITDPEHFGRLLRAIDGYRGGLIVRCALKLAPLIAVRPGELRKMEWKNVNLRDAEWRFSVTKNGTAQIVPMCRQAVAILTELQPLTGTGRYVFPNPRALDGSRPMSENAVLVALHNLGFAKGEVTGHGFRATFRTIGAEILKFRPELLEQQLTHTVRDPLGRAYNRTSFLDQRKQMMQTWADYLDELKTGKTSSDNPKETK